MIDGNEIVYVGQSYDINSRVCTHKREGIKKFDYYSFMALGESDNANEIEAILIAKFNPKYNSNLPPQQVVISFLSYRKAFNLKIQSQRGKMAEHRIHEKRFWLISDLHKIFNPHLLSV